MSHIWMSHVTHKNELCHTYERVVSNVEGVLSQVQMDDVARMNQYQKGAMAGAACSSYEWVMSHIWRSHDKHMNKSCHTNEWVMSRTYESVPEGSDNRSNLILVSMSHVTYVINSCHTYKWDVSNFEGATSHVQKNYVTHMDQYQKGAIAGAARYSYEWVTSHIWISHVILVWMSHVTRMNQSCYTNEGVVSSISTSHVTPIYESRHTYESVPEGCDSRSNLILAWMSCVTHMKRAVPSKIKTWTVNVDLYQAFKKEWHFVTFSNVIMSHF